MELLSKHIKNDRQAEWVSECRLEGVREQAVWERGEGGHWDGKGAARGRCWGKLDGHASRTHRNENQSNALCQCQFTQ